MRNIKRYGDMLKEQESLDQKQDLGEALHKAVWGGDLEKIKGLLDSGADPNTECPLGWTPLTSAATLKNLEITELLLDRGADANKQARNSRETPLHGATNSDNPDLVNLLLNRGADPNITDMFGNTPLHNSSWIGNMKIVKMLIEHGANPNTEDGKGFTPLCSAIHDKYDKSKSSLLYGFNSAAARNRGIKAAKFLILHGADPFKAFKGTEEALKFFNGDIDWMPEELKAKIKRMQRGKSAFGM
jgi:ankyrin repeat protein